MGELELYDFEDFEPVEQAQLLEEDTIKCANCRNPLVDVIKVRENDEIEQEIKALCPYCGDESYLYRINGHIFIQAAQGLAVVDNDTTVLDRNCTKFKMVIKVEKHES
jgi:DNA-directed RNA polymerase subunit RPC12/RpoP